MTYYMELLSQCNNPRIFYPSSVVWLISVNSDRNKHITFLKNRGIIFFVLMKKNLSYILSKRACLYFFLKYYWVHRKLQSFFLNICILSSPIKINWMHTSRLIFDPLWPSVNVTFITRWLRRIIVESSILIRG